MTCTPLAAPPTAGKRTIPCTGSRPTIGKTLVAGSVNASFGPPPFGELDRDSNTWLPLNTPTPGPIYATTFARRTHSSVGRLLGPGGIEASNWMRDL